MMEFMVDMVGIKVIFLSMSFFLGLNFNYKYKILILGVGESVLRGCWLLSDPSAIPPPWVLACRLGWWHEVTGPQIAKRLEKIRFEGTENISYQQLGSSPPTAL